MNLIRTVAVAIALAAIALPCHAKDAFRVAIQPNGDIVEWLVKEQHVEGCRTEDSAVQRDGDAPHAVLRRGCLVVDREARAIVILWEDGEYQEIDPRLWVKL